jgi:coiled-coil domain-containing protein 130
MPWNIWCGGCGVHIERGVRYNAEKKKVGKYYTTPIFQFDMKCHLCPNRIVMETDPKACDYKVASGGRRKNESWAPEDNETIPLMDNEERIKMTSDPMYRLEHTTKDKVKAEKDQPALIRLMKLKATQNDDYKLNSTLRASFRIKKKEIKVQEAKDQGIKDKFALGIALLPEKEEDSKAAKAITYGKEKGILNLGRFVFITFVLSYCIL